MKTKRTTRHALLLSALSLLLCMSMLVGSTFAWFTDSVTSANNIIKSGTLDVTMEWSEGKEDPANASWKDASQTAIFDYKLWEPGYTEVRHIKIANEGTLALKYQLSIVPNGKVSELADVIDVYYADPAVQVENRAALTDANKLGTLTDVLENLNETAYGELKAGENHTVTLALKMRESAGNEYQGLSIGSDFSVMLLAAQLTAEEDSFDNLYDGSAPNPPAVSGTPVSSLEELKQALADKVKEITLLGNVAVDEPLAVNYAVTINGAGNTVSRADGYTDTVFTVAAGGTLTMENVTVDGGAVWTGDVDPTLQRGTTNSGVTATGNLIATTGNGAVVLNSGAVLQNNVGAHAVSLATRGGGKLYLNGGAIINNQSDSGAIWGGGYIEVNAGSRINGNASTGLAGAIRMVSSCNLTVNGGEINHNKAATDGGVIWGYGASNYIFNGGEMAYNEAGGVGGAIYTGTYSNITISGDFAMHDNKAADSGAIRLTDHTALTMTGGKIYNNTQNGESNAFNTWNNTMNLTGGEISDDISYVGGLGLTVGAADISGVIHYDLSTNHNTAYLAADFNGFSFTVDESNSNFSSFNFKPASGYVYTAGDEAKLVCQNPDYSTYWDAVSGTFRLQAN